METRNCHANADTPWDPHQKQYVPLPFGGQQIELKSLNKKTSMQSFKYAAKIVLIWVVLLET